MKKWLTNNLGLKLISILVAMVLWLIVVNIDDPDKTRTFSNIEVRVLNQDAIEDSGKVYNILDNSNMITVDVTGPRSYLKDLTSSDIVATADLEQVDLDMGLVKIDVAVTKLSDKFTSVESRTVNMKVSIEELLSKQLPIKTEVTGTPAEGYAIGDSTTSQSIVRIQGAASVVETINTVIAEVDVSDMKSDVDTLVTLKAYDNNGRLISGDKLTFSQKEVEVSVDILKIKEVPLVFTVEGEPAEGYRVIGDVQSSITTVKVAGKNSSLKKFNEVSIASSELNVEGRSSNLETVVDISKYIRDDCKLISDKDVAVTVVIEALQAKEIIVPKEAIKLLNVADDLKASVNNDSVSIVVWGIAEELDDLSVDDLKISADLTGKVAPGMYNDVSLDIRVPDGYLAADSASVSVQLVSTLPEETVTPEETKPPLETEAPKETVSPEGTMNPDSTQAPDSTSEPVNTAEPEGDVSADGTDGNGDVSSDSDNIENGTENNNQSEDADTPSE